MLSECSHDATSSTNHVVLNARGANKILRVACINLMHLNRITDEVQWAKHQLDNFLEKFSFNP